MRALLLVFLVACGGSSSSYEQDAGTAADATPAASDAAPGDPCEGLTCDSPPPATCSPAGAVREYLATGTCSEGSCEYSYMDTLCATPPATCDDATTLRTYSSATCADGACAAESSTATCPYGCANGACQSQCDAPADCTEPPPTTCAGDQVRTYSGGSCADGMCEYDHTDTACDDPPAPVCNGSTLVSYGSGTCADGACSYSMSSQLCAHGCAAGACLPECTTAAQCDDPPADSCVAGHPRRYGDQGLCQSGACIYTPTDSQCNAPPAATCSDATHLTTYAASGTCMGAGLCDYASAQVSCPFGCAAGACQAAPGDYLAVSAGDRHTCAIRTNGTLVCWGDNTFAQIEPPAGTFTAVDAGLYGTCALRSDGTIACWGSNRAGERNPPAGTYTSITAGGDFACALKADQTAVCWGSNFAGKSTPPAGTYLAISAGASSACALRTDGKITCWGESDYGQTSPPFQNYLAVASGSDSSGGIRADGDHNPTCWGLGSSGPTGPFKQISVSIGQFDDPHRCALRDSGTIACWGQNSRGQATVPFDHYTMVSSGGTHTCALTTAGQVRCWGDNFYGQSTVP